MEIQRAGSSHSMYWVTLETGKGWLDLYLNDLPATRLGGEADRRMPVNEYLRRGQNTVRLSAARRPSRSEPAGSGTLVIERADFVRAERVGGETILAADFEVEALMRAGGMLELPTFLAAPEPDVFPAQGFDLVGPEQQRVILDQLGRAAGWWRAGDAASLLEWLQPYIQDFTRAYASESAESYAESFTRMVREASARNARVVFDPADCDLEPCFGGRLVDCLARGGGAATKLLFPNGRVYEFNIVMGVRAGRAIAVR